MADERTTQAIDALNAAWLADPERMRSELQASRDAAERASNDPAFLAAVAEDIQWMKAAKENA